MDAMKSDRGGQSAQYELVPILETPQITKGETAKLGLFLSGQGDVDRCQLTILYANSELVNPYNPAPGDVTFGFVVKDDGTVLRGKQEIEADDVAEPSIQSNTSGIRFEIPPRAFESVRDAEETGLSYVEKTHPEHGMQTSQPPYEIELETDKRASPGDYDISFILTYEVDGSVYTTREDATVHVMSRVEQAKPLIQFLTGVSVLIALVSLLHSAGIVNIPAL